MRRGYVHIWRRIKDSPLWPGNEGRKFTKHEAWENLIIDAVGIAKTQAYRDQEIPLMRGQMIISERILSKNWMWSRDKVRSFMAYLHRNHMISYHRSDHRLTIITITNYNKYNPPPKINPTTDQASDPTTDPPKTKKEKEQLKKEKKEKRVPSSKTHSEPSAVTFNFETELWENIPESKISRWKEAYPACDVMIELVRMADWLIENPAKRKKNYGAFISRWLSRQQERGGTRGSMRTETTTWAERMAKRREEENAK